MVLGPDGDFAPTLLQTSAGNTKVSKLFIRGQDEDDDTPRGLPKYLPNLASDSKDTEVVSAQKQTMYQILPGRNSCFLCRSSLRPSATARLTFQLLPLPCKPEEA